MTGELPDISPGMQEDYGHLKQLRNTQKCCLLIPPTIKNVTLLHAVTGSGRPPWRVLVPQFLKPAV